MIVTEYMENGSLDTFLKVSLLCVCMSGTNLPFYSFFPEEMWFS